MLGKEAAVPEDLRSISADHLSWRTPGGPAPAYWRTPAKRVWSKRENVCGQHLNLGSGAPWPAPLGFRNYPAVDLRKRRSGPSEPGWRFWSLSQFLSHFGPLRVRVCVHARSSGFGEVHLNRFAVRY